MRVSRVPLLIVAGVLAVLLGGLHPQPVPAAAPAAATALPAGMSRFVIAIGGLSTGSRENWVRLATVSLTSDGTATESHHHWSQRTRVSRSSTGVGSGNCTARSCTVQTANGYQSTSSPDHLTGSYTVTGSVLRLTWDGNGWEEWNISEPIAGKLAKLTFRGSSFGANYGYGYGSNAQWSTRASMSQLASFDWTELHHDYHLWKTDNGTPYLDEGSGNPFWNLDWTPCSGGRCIGGVTGSGTNTTQYYIATANTTSTDRRDTLWHWRTELAEGRGEYCYTGNSHVKPMEEIIDSDGGFHGWVAVEASLNQTAPDQGTSADDIGVFQISEF